MPYRVNRQRITFRTMDGAPFTPDPPDHHHSNRTLSGFADPWLLAIGVLSGQNIYVTYAYIGSVADGYYKRAYTPEQVQSLMKEVIGLTDVAIEHLEKVEATKIIDPDRKAIERVVEIMGLLKQEAEALSAFTRTESDADLQAYEAARTSAWPKIKEALKME